MKITGIVAFAFGAPDTISSNRRIAEIASKKAHELGAPVYTQLDVRVESGIQVEYIKEDFSKPPPTLRMARGVVQWAKRKGFTELWVVAAKPHLWRVIRDIQQAIREVKTRIKIHTCKEIEQYTEDSWFCPNSTQDRTRSRDAWDKREKILKFTPFFIYKHVAR